MNLELVLFRNRKRRSVGRLILAKLQNYTEACRGGGTPVAGSEYHADHPALPLGKTTHDRRTMEATGAERTTAWRVVQEAAQRMKLAIKPDAHHEQGHFYLSDHFALAHAGVPAFSINLGTDYEG